MNIFPIEYDAKGRPCPIESARVQCDQHAQKMYLESAQMLSTAHRLLDGTVEFVPSTDKNGNLVYLKSGKLRVKKHWKLEDDRETEMYLAVHPKHPTTLWTMESAENYDWHYAHFVELLNECAMVCRCAAAKKLCDTPAANATHKANRIRTLVMVVD